MRGRRGGERNSASCSFKPFFPLPRKASPEEIGKVRCRSPSRPGCRARKFIGSPGTVCRGMTQNRPKGTVNKRLGPLAPAADGHRLAALRAGRLLRGCVAEGPTVPVLGRSLRRVPKAKPRRAGNTAALSDVASPRAPPRPKIKSWGLQSKSPLFRRPLPVVRPSKLLGGLPNAPFLPALLPPGFAPSG